MNGQKIVLLLTLCVLSMGIIQPVLAGTDDIRDNATNYYNIAENYLNKGDYQSAIQYFDQALADNTTMIKVSEGLLYTYRDKAYAQIQLGNYAGAISTLDLGIAQYPKDKMLWNNKGYASYKQGNNQDALIAYDKAIAIESNYTTALINKGDVLSKMGRYPDAVTAYKQALESDPGNSDATKGLATAEQNAGSAPSTTIIILVIIVVLAAGLAVWYIKFRKSEPEDKKDKSAEKKTK